MKTRITELFGIEHPVIQGGMHHVGYAEMAAAVSNAGGLGIITGLTQRTPKDLANEIARCKDMTDKPIGVNLTFLPGFADPDYPGYIEAIIAHVRQNRRDRRSQPRAIYAAAERCRYQSHPQMHLGASLAKGRAYRLRCR
jgi:NAD(P)H-dependent flavin oxidoreductase YrpB (nitropropane dioxygenase family)